MSTYDPALGASMPYEPSAWATERPSARPSREISVTAAPATGAFSTPRTRPPTGIPALMAAAAEAFTGTGWGEADRGAGTRSADVFARDQLVRAVLDYVLTTEIQPMTAAHTDDPWRDLVNVLEAGIDVLARRRVILSIARESDAFDAEGVRHYLSSRTVAAPRRRSGSGATGTGGS
ncbi:hypothetical protein ACIBFB_20170 [Nocardiopsis sp. NPDC050513]|uniref:hypothetical protein n=1 Tax=Nocardiopsis sp. NPDC050513 TaxID=3364338 RepID=UPI0037BA1CCC